MKSFRQKIAFGHDVVMAAVSFPVSLLLRLGGQIDQYDGVFLLQGAALFAAVAAGVFLSMRLYSGVWRYASTNDLVAIIKSVTLAILIFLPVQFLLTRLVWMPRSTLVINWFVLMALLGGPRFIYRQFDDLLRSGRKSGLTGAWFFPTPDNELHR